MSVQRKRFLLAGLAAALGGGLARASVLLGSARDGFKTAAGAARNGRRYTMRGVTANTLDLKVGAVDTDGGMAMFEQLGRSPNGGPPLHIHPDQDESFHVLEGHYRFQVGDQRFDLGVGDTVFLPRGVPHAFIQLSEVARTIVIYQPAGDMEAFFAETAQWTTPPDADAVRRVFAAHGMQVVGPPLGRE